MSNETETAVATRTKGLKELLGDVKVKGRFEEILGKKAAAFISSIISVHQTNKALQEVEPNSIIASAAMAASLDLPINQSLGQAAIVPYKGVAQFQIMARGFIQLAQRSGQYVAMNATEVYEGQLLDHNSITGELQFDAKKKVSDKVVGYVFYFKLKSGFEHYEYMTVDQVQAHGKKFSKSYDNAAGMWKKDFPAMALKTVVKRGLSKWGPLSTEMQRAVEVDQAVIKDDGTTDYIDVPAERADAPTEKPEMPKPSETATPSESLPADMVRFIPADVTEKETSNGGFRWGIKSPEGEWYSTFNQELGQLAIRARDAKTPVTIKWESSKDGKYKNVVSLAA